MPTRTHVVVGLGEVGAPLLELIARTEQPVLGIDLEPVSLPAAGTVDVMHICFPFEIEDFVGESARYVEVFEPRLTLINSTVGVGTTRSLHERTGAPVAHSPVRGKHSRMVEELTHYAKYVGPIDRQAGEEAARHLESLGMQAVVLGSPEATELAKLTETTYFGLLIAWAQEIERYCDRIGLEYDDVVSFYDEIGFFPAVKYFPGVIGGHCVMPNIEILDSLAESPLLDAIRSSNDLKRERDSASDDSGVSDATASG